MSSCAGCMQYDEEDDERFCGKVSPPTVEEALKAMKSGQRV